MKKHIAVLTAALMTLATIATAQTTNAPATPVVSTNASAGTTTTIPTIGGLGTTLGTWLSTSDTNLSFPSVIFWDGPVYQNNVNIANELGGSYDLWRSAGATSTGGEFAAAEARFRQAGVAGAFVSEGAGGEFGYMKYDFRAGGFVDGVHLDDPAVGSQGNFVAEFGVFADKMLSQSTAVGLFLSKQIGQTYPLIGGNFNVSFGSGHGLFGF